MNRQFHIVCAVKSVHKGNRLEMKGGWAASSGGGPSRAEGPSEDSSDGAEFLGEGALPLSVAPSTAWKGLLECLSSPLDWEHPERAAASWQLPLPNKHKLVLYVTESVSVS